MMKARIIKTSEGYIPQVHMHRYGETAWFSIGGHSLSEWSDPEYTLRFATHWTKGSAMRTLKKWVKINIEGTAKLEAFKKELENPNVVYETEI